MNEAGQDQPGMLRRPDLIAVLQAPIGDDIVLAHLAAIIVAPSLAAIGPAEMVVPALDSALVLAEKLLGDARLRLSRRNDELVERLLAEAKGEPT